MQFTVFKWFAVPLASAFLVLGTATAAQTDIGPAKTPALAHEFDVAFQKGEYARAIEIGLKLAKLKPEDPNWSYNLARAYARKKDKANALKWLEKCATDGFTDLKRAKRDPDLAFIGSDQAYLDACEVIKKNRLAAWDVFKAKVAEKSPLVIVPEDYDESVPAPVLIVLHDRGGNSAEFVKVWREATQKAGVILVAPIAVCELEGGGFSWGESPDAAHEAAHSVMHALTHAIENYNVNPRRYLVGGLGQGASMALMTAYRYAHKIHGVIAVNALYDPSKAPPPNPLRSMPTRYFLMVGGDDKESLKDNRQIVEEYEAEGLEVKLRVYKGIGHEFPRDTTGELGEALEFVLSPATLPTP